MMPRVFTAVFPAAFPAVLTLAVLGLPFSADAGRPRPAVNANTPDWPMASYDATASGHNRRETAIGIDNVGSLEVKWVFEEADVGHKVGPVHGSPVVIDDAVYFGTNFGRYYKLDRAGELRWEFVTRPPNPFLGILVPTSPRGDPQAEAVGSPITGAAVLPKNHPLVIFGDIDGNIYALDRETGAEVWVQPQLDPHPLGGVVGNSLLLVGDMVVIGFSSIENIALVLQQNGLPYPCCSHRGLVVALDVATGAERWRFDTIDSVGPLPPSQLPFEEGPSGADIWGQPTWDAASDTIFFGTGQNFSPEADGSSTDTSDAIVALEAESGALKWITQLTADDVWVDLIPTPDATGRYLDTDVGDSPKVYRLGTRTVVGAGQKNGDYHVLDAQTGEPITRTPWLAQANSLGGFQQGGAMTAQRVFQHGLNRLGPIGSQLYDGVVVALSPDGTREHWRWEKFISPVVGSLAVANRVLYFQSPVEEFPPLTAGVPAEWALYALDAETGAELLRVPFSGRAISSPVVSRGRVYVGKGNTAISSFGDDIQGGLISLGLPGQP